MCKDCRCELYLGALFLKLGGKWITVLEFILQLIEGRETQKVFLKIFEGSLLFFLFMNYAGIRMCDSWWRRIRIETESAGSYSHELQLCHTPRRLLCDLGFPVPIQLHLQVRSLLQGGPYWPNSSMWWWVWSWRRREQPVPLLLVVSELEDHCLSPCTGANKGFSREMQSIKFSY